MKKFLIIVLLLLPKLLWAQKIIPFGPGVSLRIRTVPQMDGWSMGHMAGGWAISRGAKILGVKSYKTRLCIVLGSAVFYEVYRDGLRNKLIPFIKEKPVEGYGPDPMGAELVGDVMFCVLGGLMDLIFDYISTDKVLINMHGRQVGVSIAL